MRPNEGVGAAAPGPRGAAGIDLVLAGNLLVDDVVFRDGRTRIGEAGGAMLYAALGASLWGARVGVVSIAGADYPASALAALESRGVDLRGLHRLEHAGLRTWLLYEEAGRRVIHQLDRPTHEEVSPKPVHVPEPFLSAPAFHLSPMPFGRQRDLASHLARRPGALLSLDPHQAVTESTLGEWLELLSDVDGLFISEDELRWPALGTDPAGALRRLRSPRLSWVVYKRGALGGLIYQPREDRVTEWSAHGGPAVDVTGAGDAFAGGFVAALIDGGGMEAALQQGLVSASFAIEDWGSRGLLAASRAQAEERRRAWFGARVPS